MFARNQFAGSCCHGEKKSVMPYVATCGAASPENALIKRFPGCTETWPDDEFDARTYTGFLLEIRV